MRRAARSLLDAYFRDAYTDLVAATISSRSRQNAISLPEWVYDVKFPIRSIMEEYNNATWRWRLPQRGSQRGEQARRLNVRRAPRLGQRRRHGQRFIADRMQEREAPRV